MTEEQKAKTAAEVNILHAEFWDAWRETDIERGMSYYRNSPEFTFTRNGQIINGFAALDELVKSLNLASQVVTFAESKTTVLAPDIVYIVEHGVYTMTDNEGVTSPETTFAFSGLWVNHEGEWKIHFVHLSEPTPETP